MAIIYLLHNLIKVSARAELIESSMSPRILHCHCPEHPAPSPPGAQGFV